MPEFAREARVEWRGKIPVSPPRLTLGSHSITAIPLAFDRPTPHPDEAAATELMAGVFATVIGLFVIEDLQLLGLPAREISSHVVLAFTGEGEQSWDIRMGRITANIDVRADGLTQSQLEAVAQRANTRCLDSMLIRREALEAQVRATLAA
jgi:hypothetical protein